MTLFGPTSGKCPKCGGPVVSKCQQLSKVKIVHTNSVPQFIQELSMKCAGCDFGFTSYNKDYVDTLLQCIKFKLSTIIDGDAYGADMSLIRMMRNGIAAASIKSTCHANLHVVYSNWMIFYEHICQKKVGLGMKCLMVDFPLFPSEYVVKGPQLIRAFIRDYLSKQIYLLGEQAALVSEVALAMDHQWKVAQKILKRDEEINGQSFLVVGDGGIILSYVIVPDTALKWVHNPMKELVRRHNGKVLKLYYVDCNCCNGKLGGRSEKNMFWYGMLKCLDTMHCIMRIGNEINAKHPRKGNFLKQISRSIFVESPKDSERLAAA